jgi:hypothetical protein
MPRLPNLERSRLINAIFTPKVGLFFNPFFFIDLAAWNPGNSKFRVGFQAFFGRMENLNE